MPQGIRPLSDEKLAKEDPESQKLIKRLRARLPDLIDMANGDGWKYLKHIKDAAIYTRNSE